MATMVRWAGLIVVWGLLLLACLAGPALVSSSSIGDDRIRYTIRLALIGYGLTIAILLTTPSREFANALTRRLQLARWLWSLTVITYIIHVGLAFHYYHHWSHADAYKRTEDMSGFGPGIYISYFFTVVWAADALYWWLAPVQYARRSPWWGASLHVFLAFIIFSGAVTFAQGITRWSALAGFVVLGVLAARRFLQRWPFPLYHDGNRVQPFQDLPGGLP
jgi:hypothetical protein